MERERRQLSMAWQDNFVDEPRHPARIRGPHDNNDHYLSRDTCLLACQWKGHVSVDL